MKMKLKYFGHVVTANPVT